ncbi:MAG: ComF family protein [Clostridium sp.]
MVKIESQAASLLIDTIFPRRCPVCGDIVMPRGQLICPSCFQTLSFVHSPTCKKCGKEVTCDTVEYCLDCTRHKRSFEYGIALANYDDASRKSMTGIKYKNKREYLDFYIEAGIHFCGERLLRMNADAMLPVPVHPSRMRRRGFNQAEILAKGLGRGLDLPVYTNVLLRNKKTEPQKILGPSERLKNLEKAFTAEAIPDGISRVILIDDIYTTGSTIEACARTLKRAGIKKVYFFAICIGQGQ